MGARGQSFEGRAQCRAVGSFVTQRTGDDLEGRSDVGPDALRDETPQRLEAQRLARRAGNRAQDHAFGSQGESDGRDAARQKQLENDKRNNPNEIVVSAGAATTTDGVR